LKPKGKRKRLKRLKEKGLRLNKNGRLI